MDLNELMNQLANNPQMLMQLIQMMQQNGMIPSSQSNQRSPMNWNAPTNPMAALWWNNMMNTMNNQGNKQGIQNNNSTQQQNIQTEQKTEDVVLPIRVVKSPDDIKIDQIPINDKISLFMQDDMSVIYGKRWTNNGMIENLRFVLDTTTENSSTQMTNDAVTGNQGFNVEELMTAVANAIDNKLEQFKKDYSLEKCGQSRNRSNRKGGESDA